VRTARTVERMAAAILVAAAVVVGVPSAHATAKPAFRDGAASPDELIAEFLDALANKDAKALRRLRVDREEYVDLILRGNVAVGEPLRSWPDDVNEYWWSVLHTKSVYYEANILAGYGGHHYRLKHYEWTKGTKEYATYVAYKQIQITVEDEQGEERVIRTGSIAEVNGRCKFISFIRD
jgi:hypothetical protein